MKHGVKQERLLSWSRENEKDWNTICGIGEQNISEEEFIRLWELLEENGFHDVKIVLLTCHFSSVQERITRNIETILSRMEEGPQKRAAERVFYAESNDGSLQ